MRAPIFLRFFQEKRLEDSTLAISFADFSENLQANLPLYFSQLVLVNSPYARLEKDKCILLIYSDLKNAHPIHE